MTSVPTRTDVEEASVRLAGRLPRTPILDGRSLGAQLKCELFQRTGSFKARGALNRVLQLTPDERERGVIAISAGNHAAAIAFAAAAAGVDALVVMWQGASEAKIEATRRYGGTVDLEATDPAGAFERLHTLIEETGRVLVHPFDHVDVVTGQGTIGREILEQVPDVTQVVVPIGGGGLISGIASAFAQLESELGRRVRVVGVQAHNAASYLASLAAGEPVSIATPLLNESYSQISSLPASQSFTFLIVTDLGLSRGNPSARLQTCEACTPSARETPKSTV